jgi:two-component system, NtrC family, response regulator HydG
MVPRLAAIFGPLQGTSLQLSEPEVSIGRDPLNTVCISDLLLSRRHCVLRMDGSKFTISDLDSLNGIFVNKKRVSKCILEHGDRIQVGESLFVFFEQDHEEKLSQAEVTKSILFAQSTSRLRIEDADYLKLKPVETRILPAERIAQDLNSLLRISNKINSIQDIGILQRKLLELILEIFPGERAALLLRTEDSKEFSTSIALDRKSKNSVQVSDSLIQQVLQERSAILCNGVTSDESSINNQNSASASIHSLLCVPIVLSEKVLGVLYVDTRDPGVWFEEAQLQLLAGAAGIAAVAIKNAMNLEELKQANSWLKSETVYHMVGESPCMQKIYQLIAKIAPSDSTVLICGETGTGKELAARAIHLNSPRADKPFIAVNCAALTETLLESELFGHEKGSFTGAVSQKKGKLELAEGGTLFLDEISEFAPTLQAKLLRVLQEREFERVGATRSIKLNIRLLAATNKNLQDRVKAGDFRQDLFFRLNVISIEMPPLRERREDIPLLASYFVSKYNKKLRRPFAEISPQVLDYLIRYDWPGNIRELENTIERAMVLRCSDTILLEDLPETLFEIECPQNISIGSFNERIKETKKQLIKDAIEQTNGDHHEAAKLLGLHPNSLYKLIRNLKLKEDL